MWNIGSEDETLVARSGLGSDSHREPVTKVMTKLKKIMTYGLIDQFWDTEVLARLPNVVLKILLIGQMLAVSGKL